jgi:ABC-2 type transport system ATP-binding protein
MKIWAGILDPTAGDVRIFNKPPMDNLSVLNNVVYTYHNVVYDPNLRLKTILYMYKTLYAGFDAGFADKLMKFFELNGRMKYKSLSQGMGSIFNFICALSCRAPLTMMDEPVLGMDVTVRKAAYEILLREYTAHPRTFIISSHLLSEIEGILSDILLIERGRVVLHNAIDEVRNSAYRVDGNGVRSYAEGLPTMVIKTDGLTSFAVIREPLTPERAEAAKARGLKVSPVRAEDICTYLTRQNKEDELECLW